MAPAEHLEWFEDNINWFGAVAEDSLDVPVPNCPGWTVENVLNHLTFGLGVGYPIGLAAPPNAAEADVWRELWRPPEPPTGQAAIEAFTTHMTACLDSFRAAEPTQPCWTYAGPGQAGFWFRRAAIETTLHRLDVADALGIEERLVVDRLVDAIDETVAFALPFATKICDVTNQPTTVSVDESARVWSLGAGEPVASISGPGIPVLDALWGRNVDRVRISGQTAVAHAWLQLVPTAFAGR
jgi:uncharacterized protein (TIGR03083 family)